MIRPTMTRKRARYRIDRMRAWMRRRTGWIPRPVRRVIVAVIGGTLLVYALAGMVLPVLPGFIFLPFALAILALEFAWAARWLKKLKRGSKNVRDRWRGSPGEAGANSVPNPEQSKTHVVAKPKLIPPAGDSRPGVAA